MASLRLLLLFGTETGNAQDVAAAIAREAQLLSFKPVMYAMDAFDVSRLPEEQLVVFVASTAGQGDHPSNMKRFWRFLLRKSLPPDSLCNIQYAVFGLGDSGYVKYNVVAKKLHNRLANLGGRPLMDVGLGDDQHPNGYEAALDRWLPQLWRNVSSTLGVPTADALAQLQVEGAKLQLGAPKFRVKFLPRLATSEGTPTTHVVTDTDAIAAAAAFRTVAQYAAGLPPPAAPACTTPSNGHTNVAYGPWQPYMARMTTNKRITAPAHFQDTRHIEFDLGDSGLAYEPGDVLAVFPKTPSDVVEAMLKRFEWCGDDVVEISAADPPVVCEMPPVATCSLRALLQGALDLVGASPRRYFFQVMSHFSSNELEVERLQYFSSAEGRDDLYRYNNKERRSVWEVLQDFKHTHPPLQWLLECCPLLQPRYFSLSSSQLLHPNQAHITLAVVKWLTPTKRERRGLCSTWLAGLDPERGDVRVPVWVERGTLRLPPSMSTPLLMIGPGTGVAPFRSFIQHRHASLLSPSPPPPLSPSILFFGCRSHSQDFYYQQEWPTHQASGALHPTLGLQTAFSRDQSNKVYVTHKIQEQSDLVWQLLQEGGVVYVSGSAEKMPADVKAALVQVVVEKGGVSKLQAEKLLQQMEVAGRYQVETWS